MKAIHDVSAVCRLSLAALCMLGSGVLAGGEEPKGEVASDLVVEIWPLEEAAVPRAPAVPLGFEKLRAKVPPAGGNVLALDKLEIPARETPTMVRVRGELVVPQTREYAITVESPDPAELWLLDELSGEWRLAQRANNPKHDACRVKLEEGVSQRFELWAAGKGKVAVLWNSRAIKTRKVTAPAVVKQVVPGVNLRAATAMKGIAMSDGLPDDWKLRRGLNPVSGDGADGPWGDPDGDSLLNWQERLADTDPRKADSLGCRGFARWELWRGIPGKYVFDLERSGDFPLNPSEVRYLRRLEIPYGNGDRYGSRLRCLVTPPADGTYTFTLIANDTAELWLGDDESWQGKKLVAKVVNEGEQLAFPSIPKGGEKPLLAEQVSDKIDLRAGKRYYLEVLHKQGEKADHCAVGWTVPGAKGPAIVPGAVLTAWAPEPGDTNDDGLPDDWQKSAGLLAGGVDSSQRHAYADPDHDGITNRDEWKAGTKPLDAGPTAVAKEHLLTCEVWTGLHGERVADLAHSGRYPAAPSHATLVDNLDFSHEGENYGCRLRGYLTAPADGPYHFYVSGNNACVLWLAESEDKFTKHPLVRTIRDTGWRHFQGRPAQRSEPVVLKRGARYYVELLFKRGTRQDEQAADHSSVAWLRPDRPRMAETVIGREFLEPYGKDPRDRDDDDLPDDWEELHSLDPADPSGSNGSWGDQDGDGLENFREFQYGLDPLTADVHGTPGLALWEAWDNLSGLPAAHRDGPGLAPAFVADPRFPFHPARREWRDALEAPHSQGTNFGARLRAYVIAPTTGDYVFSIAGRDVGELYLSPDDSKFNRLQVASIRFSTSFRAWNVRAGQMTKPVRLEAGKAYYIEALHARGSFRYDDDFFSIGWKQPGAKTFEGIGAKHLLAFFRDPNDLNDDDLPDDWQKENGISLDAPGDSDLDGDGLTNREEYHLGTRADRADTDGDGVSDLDEVRVYGSNPLAIDAVPPKLHTDFVLDRVISPPGTWLVSSDGVLTSTAMRGTASFKFTVDAPGLYVVRLDARVIGKNGYTPPVPVSALVDGVEIGRGVATIAEGGLSWVTRWLTAGTHDVTIQNRNYKFTVNLAITSLKLLKMVGEDGSGDGMPAWYERIIQPANSFALSGTEDLEMRVSPACIEGTSRMPGSVQLDVNGKPCEALPGIGTGWYGNVPLAEKGRTVIDGIFEGGAITRRLNLVWSAVDPFLIEDRMDVRVGDAMKFAVSGPDSSDVDSGFSLALDGKEIFSGPSGSEVVVRFERSGEQVLEATRSGKTGAETRRITVSVMKADFGPTFSIAAEVPRNWNLPGVSPLLTLESDPLLQLDSITPLQPAGLRATAVWKEKSAAQPMVLARLSQGGPILAAACVNVFKLVDAAVSGDAHVVEVLADGTRVVEISYLIEGRIPDDFTMWIDFAVTDAVFADGSTRYLLTAKDFDESGVARIKIYKAPGSGPAFVCHWNRLFENDKDATTPETETEESE